MNAMKDIVARMLGHDLVLLRSRAPMEDCCLAVFAHYSSYDTELLMLDGKRVEVKCLDSAGRLRRNEDMYDELAAKMFRALKNGGTVSDKMHSLNASMVPEFMIGCVLDGCI